MSRLEKTALASATAEIRAALAEVGEGVESIRLRLATLGHERTAILEQAVPIEEAMRRFDARLDAIAEEALGKFPFFALFQPNDEAYIQQFCSDEQGVAVLIAACREPLRALIQAKLKKLFAKQSGVDPETRAARLAAIDEEIFDLNLSEESLIRAAEAAGMEILRRAAADPRAVLAADSELPQ